MTTMTRNELADALDSVYRNRSDLLIVAVPGGQQGGLDYGPVGVEVVALGDGMAAYRSSSDELDGDWQVGDADAIMDMVASLAEGHANED